MTEPEETTDSQGNLLCPKCGAQLWFYRNYKERITRGEHILEIGYTEWDEEYVECADCKDRPKYEWYGEELHEEIVLA